MSDVPTAELTCPKCRASMRSYERSGVTVDQCNECRGIFLDRGELERLIDAEEQRYGSVPQFTDPRRDDGATNDGHHGQQRNSGRRRRGGFLGDLFD